MKILLVEDDPDLLDVTAYALRRERFVVVEATDGSQALHRLKVDRPDLLVLDSGLPKQEGITLLQRVREKDSTPVVVLTGRNDEPSILKAFSLGADDYVIKPFAAKQLAMRIRAILRRTSNEQLEQAQPALDIGALHIEPEIQEITWHGQFMRLTPTEFRIFHLLAMHVGRSVTTGRLLAYVWGYEGGDPNALRTHISHVRSKLQLGSLIGAEIIGIPGVGYRFQLKAESAAADDNRLAAQPALGRAVS